MKVWRIVAALSFCLILIGSTACNPFGGAEEEISQQLIEVTRGDLTVSVSGSGNIEVANEVKAAFGVSGKIDKIYVDEGDKVSKGDVLAQLDTGALELALTQAQLSEAQAQLSVTQAQLSVTQAQLSVTQAQVSEVQAKVVLAQAQLGVTQAEIALETAKYNLDRMEDVAEAKDDITDAEYEVKIAEMRLKEANALGGDDAASSYWRTQLILAQIKLAEAQQDLAELLAEDEYATLVVDEVAIKQLQVKAAEESLEVARLSVEQARHSSKLAELSVEQARQSLGVAKLSVEQAQQSLKQARQSREQAQKQRDEATIVAPFSGTIARVYVDEGATVSTATAIFHLLDLANMELQVEVDEMDIPDVEIGQKTIVKVDALPLLHLEGKITYISPLAKKEGGLVLYELKIGFVAPDGSKLRAGMSATADIVLDRRSNVLLLPNRAIKLDSQGNPLVKVKEGEQIEERAVRTGINDGFQTEIVGGLNEGETVVIETQAKPKQSGGGLF